MLDEDLIRIAGTDAGLVPLTLGEVHRLLVHLITTGTADDAGIPERRTHDYARNCITGLLAAFNVADGTVISKRHRQRRATEFEKFLTTFDKTVPAALDIHLICDNHGTHKTPRHPCLAGQTPRFHLHVIPTGSSWLNQVERWFGTSPNRRSSAAHTRASSPSKPTSDQGSPTGTATHAHSSGPRPPRRSSTHSPDL